MSDLSMSRFGKPTPGARSLLAGLMPSQRTKEMVDWAVFSLGAVSLIVAIAATLIGHGAADKTAVVDPEDMILVQVLPDVL
jgi:hypothetical protein